MRIIDLFEFHSLALTDDLYKGFRESGILKEHRSYEAYSEKVILPCGILFERNISDHLYGLEFKSVGNVRDACPVYESDIAVTGDIVLEDDIARVTLFELLPERKTKESQAFHKTSVSRGDTLAQDIVAVASIGTPSSTASKSSVLNFARCSAARFLLDS